MTRPNRGNIRRTQAGRGKSNKAPCFPDGVADAVMVNGYSSEWLSKGFDWVYPAEIVAMKGRTQSGSVVEIVSKDGLRHGVGVASDGKVAVRRFRTDVGPIDGEFIGAQVAAARSRRRVTSDTTAWRMIHGENDSLPGIRVDIWGSHATVSMDHESLEGVLNMVVAALESDPQIDTIWLSDRPEHDELRGGAAGEQCLVGDPAIKEVVVTEHGLRYRVSPHLGLDAGLYSDMRGLRRYLAPHWKGRRVLNTFAYTGAFSVAAAAGGATSVDTVDLAAPAIARAKANFELNELAGDQFQFWTEDTFVALDRFRRSGTRFDIIVVDPPSFAHGPGGVWSVEKDLSRVVAGCLRVLEPGGWILVATNQGSISPKEFQKYIKSAAQKVGRRLRLIHQGSPPHDIPAALDFPESRYLKAWILEG
jgi:23S rRNA (cytosine1962-C5)-methyltransferase